MKNIKKIMIVLLLVLVLFGCSNKTEERINTINEQVKYLELTSEEETELNNKISKLNKKTKEEDIKSIESEIDKIKSSNKWNLLLKEQNLVTDIKGFSASNIEKYTTLKNEYDELKRNENYKEANIKLDELITFADELYSKTNKKKQPDVVSKGISIASKSIKVSGSKLTVKGTYDNTTKYDYSKIVIRYNAVKNGCTPASAAYCSCGTYDIVIKNVKGSSKKSFSGSATIKNACKDKHSKAVYNSVKGYK